MSGSLAIKKPWCMCHVRKKGPPLTRIYLSTHASASLTTNQVSRRANDSAVLVRTPHGTRQLADLANTRSPLGNQVSRPTFPHTRTQESPHPALHARTHITHATMSHAASYTP